MKAYNSNRKRKLIKRFLKGALTIDCNRIDICGWETLISDRGTKVKAGGGNLTFKRYDRWLDRHSTLTKIEKFLGHDIKTGLSNFRKKKLFGITEIVDAGLATTRKEASKLKNF